MSKSDMDKEFFDEIIDSLRASEMDSEVTYVSKDVLLEFYRPAQKVKRASSPVPVSVSAVAPAFAGVSAPVQKEEKTPLSSCGIGGKEPPQMDMTELKNAVSICSKCLLCRTRTNTVFGDGNEKARLMFIGEGPGADEDAQGLPFVGKAGELLTKMINAMGFARREVYIGNIVKCRPPGNRTPEEEEIKACLPYIERQIELIQPEAIVLLGATPLKGLFNMTGISRLRGKFLQYKNIPAMPTFHPAYLLRNPAAKADVWKDLQMVMKLFGKEPPQKK